MGWKGIAIGSWLGSLFGGPLGALLGAALGHQVEKHIVGGGLGGRGSSARAYGSLSDSKRSMIFCASAAAMLAKMAKADGRVSREEIAGVERAFARLGFRSTARDYAIKVFRSAKDDSHTIFQYAREFANAVDSVEVRELFYEILWDIACADGIVSDAELRILQRIPRDLGIRVAWYGYFFNQRVRGGGAGAAEPENELAQAYAVLGAQASDTPEELKRKYRTLAKKNHPDALRAQGLPEALIGKATERMGRINSAWATIRAARDI